MARKSDGTPIPVEAHKHHNTRVNIPTEELSGFVADDEKAPKTLRWPRDPSLDPQLVWKGKDESDGADLEVPSVPVYIQEKIHPQALVEHVRAESRRAQPQAQVDLFGDFNGVKFEDMVDFYHHEQHWSNRMILGDSLLVMASLADKERLKGRVQVVYFDPPYGVKFGSNWQVSTRRREVKDGKSEDATRQPEQVRAFRDTWKDGIHSYLPYLRDRLQVALSLLTDSGSCFVQIGDENVHLVRSIMDEVFGPKNFVLTIVVKKKGSTTATDPVNDFIVWYAKDRDQLKVRTLTEERDNPDDDPKFNTLISPTGEHRRINDLSPESVTGLVRDGWRYARVNYPIVSQHPSATRSEDFTWRGRAFSCGANAQWRFDLETHMPRLAAADRLFDGGGKSLGGVLFWRDWPYVFMTNIWDDLHGDQEPIYVVQTNRKIVQRCLLMTTDPGDLVLDPTCGSGTTAYVAEQWGRRWITIDTSRVAMALARTRLMAAKFPYFLLSDSAEGARKEAELSNRPTDLALPKTTGDLRRGFVYKRVPHVTLKSIANNAELDEIDARWRPELDRIRAELNRLLKTKWQEWDVPRDPETSWHAAAKTALAEWWKAQGDRLKQIDASVAARADIEYLFDQPYEDPKRIRVTGPFTVESLAPHRVLPADDDRPQTEKAATDDPGAVQFTTTILDNLRKAGVQNTRKTERLKFDRLDVHPGRWLHAAGEYTDGSGSPRRVAVHLGPEHGTVGTTDIKEAAKEAMKGAGFDLLLVCGFAFDPHAGETAKQFSPEDGSDRGWAIAEREEQYGRLRVLLVRMNQDLAMGGDLLKKTGAGNLFMVFGEPDVTIVRASDGRFVVELKGLDIYDPTTGQVHPSSTDEVACWFVDTDYNEESFFVRHAYFTGGDDPYDKLRRALKAEVDEAAWRALYTTKSLPFDKPRTGKIAVKVINHYGDEVLKVFEVGG